MTAHTRDSVILLNPPGDGLYIRDYYCSFSSKADYYWPPQDLIVLSGILAGRYEVKVIDAIVNRISEEACLERILSADPGSIIFATGTATLKADLQLAERIKNERGRIRIIASAGIKKFIGRNLLKGCGFIDAVLTDCCEQDVLSYIGGGCSTPLKGIIYKKEGRLVESSAPLPFEFTIPVPRHELFDFPKYRTPIAKRLPFTVVATSFGCPYRCGFCTAGAFGYRVRKVENVLEEFAYLHALGIKEIYFADQTFTASTERVAALCRGMMERDLSFTWSCNADVKSLNEEKVAWMKKAGCHTVAVGIESGDDAILKKYSKRITTGQIRHAVSLLNKHGLRILGYFILGLPGETKETIIRTIDLARSLKIDFASFAIATPDCGTALRKEALDKGWISPEEYSFDSTGYPVIETGDLSGEDIWRLRKTAVRKFYLRPSYLMRRLSQIRSLRDLRINVFNALSLLCK